MNKYFNQHIDFTMNDNSSVSLEKKKVFKELIIEYLIRNIIGDNNAK